MKLCQTDTDWRGKLYYLNVSFISKEKEYLDSEL